MQFRYSTFSQLLRVSCIIKCELYGFACQIYENVFDILIKLDIVMGKQAGRIILVMMQYMYFLVKLCIFGHFLIYVI